MLERLVPFLKILCLGLLVLVLFQGTCLLRQEDPLANLSIPAPTDSDSSLDPMEGDSDLREESSEKEEDKLPPTLQARLEWIRKSEIFGAVPKKKTVPLALIGIVGKYAFLRVPKGQEGRVAEGDELGGVKLIRIGTNRVLVEYQGQKQELTIFSGLGSESILPEGKEKAP